MSRLPGNFALETLEGDLARETLQGHVSRPKETAPEGHFSLVNHESLDRALFAL